MTGWTVVTREAEWDDRQRDRMTALDLYEAGVGPCGFHHSLTSDLSNRFTFFDEHCNLCAGMAKSARMQHASDEDEVDATYGKDGPPASATLPGDGRRTFARMMGPLEISSPQVDAAPR